MSRLFTVCCRSAQRLLFSRLLLLAAIAPTALALALALESNQIRVLRSDGTPVTATDGVSAAGYLGASHRCNGTLLDDGIFEFPAATPIYNARIARHYLTSPGFPLAGEIALVEFRVDVLASGFQGGAPTSVNHGLSVYQGSSHKAYFPAPAAPGMYHIDVVPGDAAKACAPASPRIT